MSFTRQSVTKADLAAERSFSRLWEHRDHVAAYVRRRSPTVAICEDVVSDTYLVAWRLVRMAPADEDGSRAWLCTIARNVLANASRRVRRQLDLQSGLAQSLDNRWSASSAPDRLGMVEAYGALSPTDRKVLSLVATSGLGPDELAQHMGCSRNAAAVRLHRARRRLELLLQAN